MVTSARARDSVWLDMPKFTNPAGGTERVDFAVRPGRTARLEEIESWAKDVSKRSATA
jgi:hypothetical protein